MRSHKIILLFIYISLASALLIAPQIASAVLEVRQFSPQGEVRNVTQVTAVFNEDVVKLGDTDAESPFDVSCTVSGSGRWMDAKTWRYQLSGKLGSGDACHFKIKPNLAAQSGATFSAYSKSVKDGFMFYMAAPWLSNILPEEEDRVEEDQHFIVDLPFEVKTQSVEAHAWCQVEGVGEHIPVRVLLPADTLNLVKNLRRRYTHPLALHCQRPLPAGVKMKLVWGRGIESTSRAKTSSSEEKIYTVRPAFRAELTCTRENPSAPCSPLSDLRLRFTDQVSIEFAQKIKLVSNIAAINPRDVSPIRKKELVAQNAKAFYRDHVLVGKDYLDEVVFKGPFNSNTTFKIILPEKFADLSGRTLANANRFPLKTKVGSLPPLAKFAADFGVLELKEGGVLPVTLRNVESKLAMRVLRKNDAEGMFSVMQDLAQFESQTKTIKRNLQKLKQRSLDGYSEDDDEGYDVANYDNETVDYLYPRELSFLESYKGAQPSNALPKLSSVKAFEVLGIPLAKPGFYVVEIQSKLLGTALLSEAKPMYVRSQALVTDLSVHLKKGRDNSLVWVTSLATGKVVKAAQVALYDCNGGQIWQGETDANGLAIYQDKLPELHDCKHFYSYYATAKRGDDFSFVRSDWDKGIEPWRFNVNTWAPEQNIKMQTVLDRTMLRADETVSMKHFARELHYQGYRYPKKLPDKASLELVDGDFTVDLPLTWDARGVATSQWKIPKDAKMGTYGIKIEGADDYTAQFRVSEFRLPAYKGTVQTTKARYAGISKLPVNFSLAYLNGGSASGQAVQVSAMRSGTSYQFANYDEFNFNSEHEDSSQKLVLDKKAIKLDAQGMAHLDVPVFDAHQKLDQPVNIQTEMTFTDPSGEIQTIAGNTEIWPAKIAIGLQIKDWAGLKGAHKLQAVALDLNGKPVAGVNVKISGVRKWEYVHRKRIIGGFYSYETEENKQDLGQVCEGKTDALGFFQCQVDVKEAGSISLQAQAVDDTGALTQTSAGFWVSDDADFWFAQGDEDRIEVIPEKREYQPGEKARFQIHSPFYQATALISVEREGVLKTIVQPLYRRNAVVEIPIEKDWGPNVFVSALVVRGRITTVPWYSFFEWGWHSPIDWAKAKWQAVPQATALVDLAKPAYKFGLTRIAVGIAGNRLSVAVDADKKVYQPREMATVKVKVLLPSGKPAPAGSEVAVAAVDRALLELSPNHTWDLLDNMQEERAYLMETATAQMQVVGKRHFGKKSLPAGGGGGKLSTRELFDTLLYWNPRVKLNAQGMATVKFPVNDSLTAFKIVAIADADKGLFGKGSAEIQSRQDLQITSGIPPLVREADQYRAMLTLRNSTETPMQVQLTGTAGAINLRAQTIALAVGEAKDAAWQLQAPNAEGKITWQINALDTQSKKHDALRFTQQVLPRVPATIQQSSLMQLDGIYSTKTALPQGAILGKGGLEVRLTASIAQQTAGIQRYFEEYPYSCLEQKTSIATGLNDKQRWDEIVNNLASYQDSQGYLAYFPGMAHGSDALTNYLLTMAYENKVALPQEVERNMRKALIDFVEGRSKPTGWYWGANEHLKERRLSALAALAYTGNVNGNMLSAFEFKPIQMPTSTLIDWYAILKRVPDAESRDERMSAVSTELHNRLQNVGGRLVFDQEENDVWWWAMIDGELNATRLTTLLMDDPAWKDDMVGMMRGALMRQNKGRWHTTLANAWGRLALAKFGQQFEREAVTGKTTAQLNAQQQSKQWGAEATTAKVASPDFADTSLFFAWPQNQANSEFSLKHEGTGKPWANLMLSAAIPEQAKATGYHLKRTVTAIEQKVAGQWSRGDLMRIRIDIDSDQALSWVALSDPIPAGASILGNTARDSKIAQVGENKYDGKNGIQPSYTERGLGFFRAYYEFMPKGHVWYEYTVRLNNPGQFNLPPTRVEAMYAPEIFAQVPNAQLSVQMNAAK